ncbi:SDR family oxidoreductase [Baaleninema simplex]|uniref:SDR family oxidoreductase n=1 Tax=Baaleninema simplex TaxID=2862350 RepID=UPI0003658229|nr:SDR family oxidoreductase [Baaleninema simplex]
MTAKGKRALITGASSGIGEATAMAFAKAGIHVALLSRSANKLEKVAEAARQEGVEVETLTLDLLELDRVREQVSNLAEKFGGIDILVNNAGMAYTAKLMDTPLHHWRKVLDLNLTSAFECVKGVLPGMRSRGSGIIVNVVSVAGKQAFPIWGAYSASKFGLLGMSQALAAEERENGIRVTAMCPGAVNTPIWETETVDSDFDRSKMLTPEIVAESILHVVGLPDGAVVEELVLMPSGGAF